MMSLLDDSLAILAGVLLLACGVLLFLNAGLRSDLAIARANAGALTLANSSLKDGIEKQNAAIGSLSRESAAREQRVTLALAAAQIQVMKFKRRADALTHAPATNDDCQSAQALLQTYLKARP